MLRPRGSHAVCALSSSVSSPALREAKQRQLALFPRRDTECSGCEREEKRGGEDRNVGGALSRGSAWGLPSYGHHKHKA